LTYMNKNLKIENRQHQDLRKFLFDRVLPFVRKPGRYTGNEINIIRKDLGEVDVRVALVFPDVYEVGMSYMGFPILYHILNSQKGVYAERAFAPWIDMEGEMRKKGIPLFSLETFSPLSDFDIIGFTLQYEMHYTTVLNLLDLSGLPVEAKDRDGMPLIIGGGPCAFNPEPVADFFDAIMIGDGEEASVEIVETVRRCKYDQASKEETLEALAAIPWLYVPSFYRPRYSQQGAFLGLEPVHESAPRKIKARIVEALKPDYYSSRPLVPMISTTHDRVSLEIARGCSRGCRFCNAGMIYRPVRQRKVNELVDQALESVKNTGYDEVSLVSLSTSDYDELSDLLQSLRSALGEQMVNISFPSLRPEKFTYEVAQFAKGVRKSGLTLAPEAGSQRLRDVINKTTKSEDLLRAVDLAFREGWNLIKLYFMIGQPTETDEDLYAMIDLITQVVEVARLHGGKRIHVSVSPFIPKPITPFQWVKQDDLNETHRKLRLLCDGIRFRNVKMSWRQPELAAVEGILARGDRRLAPVIKSAWLKGAKFDGWSEHFNFERWQQALDEHQLSFDQLLAGFELDAPLPWDHIDKRVTKKFLRDEYRRAFGQIVTPDCRDGECNLCGLMGQKVCQEIIQSEKQASTENSVPEHKNEVPHIIQKSSVPEKVRTFRVKYAKGEAVRYLSHLDLMRVLERAMIRADLPLIYSEGFNPRPRIAYGPSLATGYTSEAEYFDLQLAWETAIDLQQALGPHLPAGLELLQTKSLFGKAQSLTSIINRAGYDIAITDDLRPGDLPARIERLLGQKEIIVSRKKKDGVRSIDIRPFLVALNVTEGGFYLETTFANGKTLRVDEILKLLFPEEDIAVMAKVHRKGLWVQYGSLLASPMDI